MSWGRGHYGLGYRTSASQFLGMLIFNTVVAAPDAHARNYAVLLDGGRVRLAPMFDAASSVGHDPSDGSKRVVSMAIGGEFRVDQIGADHGLRLADELGVSGGEVLDRVCTIAEDAPSAFSDALSRLDHEDAPTLAERMLGPLRFVAGRFARTAHRKA